MASRAPKVPERLRFARELRDAAALRRMVPRLVSDAPEEWRLGPLTVRVDRRRDAAVVRYARLPVAVGLTCDVEAIFAGCRRAFTQLVERSVAPQDLATALALAYRNLVVAETRPIGTRVLLSHLFPEVMRVLPRSRRGYTRAQFAFDLARLRRERHLHHEGHRIDLEVATGGAA